GRATVHSGDDRPDGPGAASARGGGTADPPRRGRRPHEGEHPEPRRHRRRSGGDGQRGLRRQGAYRERPVHAGSPAGRVGNACAPAGRTTRQRASSRATPRRGARRARRPYASRRLGADARLVLHGAGNTSVKGTFVNRLGESIPAIYVKASGYDLATIEPEGHPGLDLGYLRKLRALPRLDDEAMANELRTHVFDALSATPSVETLVHAFLPAKYVDHTHADAILALTNQTDGERVVREALGDEVVVLGYVRPGFQLARAVADAYEAHANAPGMVWMRHGLMTWGPSARASYEAMIDLVTRAEEYLAQKGAGRATVGIPGRLETALARVRVVAPVLRGALAEP